MTYSKKEILDALLTIKTTCEENRCRGCPFGNENCCNITLDIPCDWEIDENRGLL